MQHQRRELKIKIFLAKNSLPDYIYRMSINISKPSSVKITFLLLSFLSVSWSFGQPQTSKKYDKEPASTYEVKVNGKSYIVSEVDEINIDSMIKPIIQVRQLQNKKFENSSYSFEYPKNLSFEYSEEVAIRTWTLNGNSVVILLFEMDVENTLDNFVTEMAEKFGKSNCKVGNFSKKLGNKLCSGKTLTVTLAGQTLVYECYSVNTSKNNSRFIFLQDSSEGTRHTKEFDDILSLMNSTISYK